MRNNRVPKLIFIVGVDGAGKTLYTNMLLDKLRDNGVEAQHVWSRYNNYVSKPLLAFTFLTGHNYKENHNDIQFGYHDFFRSQVISSLFIMCQTVDVNIATYFKIRRHVSTNKVLVCDRGPYDTLIDVMLDTGRSVPNENIVKLFLSSLPKDHFVLYLYRPLEEIYTSRPELKYDKNLPRKNELYDRCCDYFGWEKIENIKSPTIIMNEIATSLLMAAK